MKLAITIGLLFGLIVPRKKPLPYRVVKNAGTWGYVDGAMFVTSDAFKNKTHVVTHLRKEME